MRLKALGVPKEEPMRIVQKKMPLNNIEGVKAYMQETDLLTGEKGVAKMSCGHKVGRKHLISIVRKTLANKQIKVKCPLAIDCQKWDWN